jgi:hypothetical protein
MDVTYSDKRAKRQVAAYLTRLLITAAKSWIGIYEATYDLLKIIILAGVPYSNCDHYIFGQL